jgi:hypothetical protein
MSGAFFAEVAPGLYRSTDLVLASAAGGEQWVRDYDRLLAAAAAIRLLLDRAQRPWPRRGGRSPCGSRRRASCWRRWSAARS